jgi:hypothetical protein
MMFKPALKYGYCISDIAVANGCSVFQATVATLMRTGVQVSNDLAYQLLARKDHSISPYGSHA